MIFLLLSFKGFWKKEEYYREVPTVSFKKQLLVVFELEQEGSYITYSTYQRYNQLQQQNIRIPLIQVKLQCNCINNAVCKEQWIIFSVFRIKKVDFFSLTNIQQCNEKLNKQEILILHMPYLLHFQNFEFFCVIISKNNTIYIFIQINANVNIHIVKNYFFAL